MRTVTYSESALAEISAAAEAHSVTALDLDGYLQAVGRDIGVVFDSLITHVPDYPNRRIYQRAVEGLGDVSAICQLDGPHVIVLRIGIAAFWPKPR